MNKKSKSNSHKGRWPRRHNVDVKGYIPAAKPGEMLPYKSNLQRATAHHLIFDHTVIDIQIVGTLVATIDIKSRMVHEVRAGYWIELQSGKVALVSCEPRHASRYMEVSGPAHVDLLGYRPRVYVVTPERIQASFRLGNIEALAHYASYIPPADFVGRALGIMSMSPSLPLGELACRLDPDNPRRALRRIFALMYRRALLADIDRGLITEHTPLWLPGTAPYPPSILALLGRQCETDPQ